MIDLAPAPADRIERDLQIAEAMVEEIPHYLKYDGLFYPLSQASYPRLTLGSYLMRQHRLLAVVGAMDKETAERLTHTTEQFQAAISDNIVRVEQHANQELKIRVKQWDTHLTEVTEKPEEYAAYYGTHAADRTILEAILDFMQPPYQPDPQARNELNMLDFVLHGRWQDGPFIWAEVWQPAYPQERYWWLYGRPALEAQENQDEPLQQTTKQR